MKMKFAEIGLGFSCLMLLGQVLWFVYGTVTSSASSSFLWLQLTLTGFLATLTGWLWRRTFHDKVSARLKSLVLLLRSSRDLTIDQLHLPLSTALGVNFRDDNSHSTDFLCDTPPAFQVQVCGYSFRINNSDTPYIDQNDNTSEHVPNVRLQQVIRDHRAWLSVDLIEAPKGATSDNVYQYLGRMIAALADDDCIGLFCPETNQLNVWHPTLTSLLLGPSPLQALSAITDVPAVRITANDTHLEEAAQKANSMWNVFANSFAHRSSEQTFAVKAPFTNGKETEYMWLLVSAIGEETVTGTLDNEPIYVRNVRVGETVTVSIDQVNDWLYTDGGELVGGFTNEVLNRQMAA